MVKSAILLVLMGVFCLLVVQPTSGQSCDLNGDISKGLIETFESISKIIGWREEMYRKKQAYLGRVQALEQESKQNPENSKVLAILSKEANSVITAIDWTDDAMAHTQGQMTKRYGKLFEIQGKVANMTPEEKEEACGEVSTTRGYAEYAINNGLTAFNGIQSQEIRVQLKLVMNDETAPWMG